MIKRFLQALVVALVLGIAPVMVFRGTSYADGTVNWTGQGVSGGKFDTEQCKEDTPNPGDVLWVFTATGADSATITINGQTSSMTQEGNGAFHFVQTGFNGNFSTLTASATFSGDTNSGNPQLVISHGCPGGGEGGGPQKDCDNDFDNSPESECQQPQKDCDNDFDNSPQSECQQPQKDCDNDTDNSPASECTTTTGGQGGGQVLGASTTAGVSVTPVGGVNAGAGGGSALSVQSLTL